MRSVKTSRRTHSTNSWETCGYGLLAIQNKIDYGEYVEYIFECMGLFFSFDNDRHFTFVVQLLNYIRLPKTLQTLKIQSALLRLQDSLRPQDPKTEPKSELKQCLI